MSGRIASLDQRLAVGPLDEAVDGLVEHGSGPEHSLEDGSRRLAGSEAGDAGAAAEGADGLVDGAAEALGGELDLENDGALRGRGGCDVHRRGSIGRVAGRGPCSRVSGGGRRVRCRSASSGRKQVKRTLIAWWPIIFLIALAIFVYFYVVVLPKVGTT